MMQSGHSPGLTSLDGSFLGAAENFFKLIKS
jgi:hypothetical protein